jgi:hypothetical protein
MCAIKNIIITHIIRHVDPMRHALSLQAVMGPVRSCRQILLGRAREPNVRPMTVMPIIVTAIRILIICRILENAQQARNALPVAMAMAAVA